MIIRSVSLFLGDIDWDEVLWCLYFVFKDLPKTLLVHISISTDENTNEDIYVYVGKIYRHYVTENIHMKKRENNVNN